MTHWRLALGLLAAAGYAVLSYWLMTRAPHEPWAVAVILGPLLLAAFGWALGQRHLPTMLAALIAAALLAGVVLTGGVDDLNELYVLQHAGIHAALGLSFFASLRAPSGLTVIGLLASRLHAMTPAMVDYTRQVTKVWIGYFAFMAGTSVLVYGLLPWATWSAFASLFTPLSAVALFVGEHRMRYVLHPEFERVGLIDGLRAWQGTPAAPGKAGGR